MAGESAGPPLRVFLDANVLVAAVLKPRWPYAVLQAAVAGRCAIALSGRVIDEARDALAERFPQLLRTFEQLLDRLPYESVPTPTESEIDAHSDLVPRDPDDVHVALAAIKAQVDCLVTLDTDLSTPANTRLRQLLVIKRPGTFLREDLGWTESDLSAIQFRDWEEVPPAG